MTDAKQDRFLRPHPRSLRELAMRPEVWALFVLALVLRAALIARGIDQIGFEPMFTIVPDAQLYLSMAKAFLSGSEAFEHRFFTFGPGHAWYLAAILWLSDGSLWAVLITNLLLSSLTCVLVYAFAWVVLGSRAVSTLAALAAAVSMTGIELTAIALSEIPFMFFFGLGNLLFLRSFQRRSFGLAVASGVCLASAVLIRPIAQFWPVVVVFWSLVMVWPRTAPRLLAIRDALRPRLPVLVVAIAIPLLVSLSWSVRNLNEHGAFALAFSSAGGPANIAAMAVGNDSDEYYRDITTRWLQECRGDRSWDEFPIGERFDCLRDHTNDVLRSDPFGMMGAWLDLTWDNINEITYLHRFILPENERQLVRWEYGVKDKEYQYLPLILVLLGLGTLLVRGRFGDMVLLGSFFAYFALLIGFTKFQGSRLIYPAYFAGDVLIAIGLAGPLVLLSQTDRFARWRDALGKWMRRFYHSTVHACEGYRLVRPELLYIALVVGLVVVLFREFIFTDAMLFGGDTVTAGVFFRSFLVDHVHRYGTIPMWNPYIFCGLPFVDAFHGDIFYPLSVMKFFGTLYRMLGWIFILHIVLAGTTMYFTARELGLRRLAASFSGLVYMLAPYTISFVSAGHDGKLFVTALFPLLILFTHRLFRSRPVWNATWLALTIGTMILTPHPQLSYYALLLLAIYGLYQSIDALKRRVRLPIVLTRASLMLAAVVLGVAISSIQMLPAVRYTLQDGPRSTSLHGYQWATAWSLHLEEVVSQAAPGFAGVDSPGDASLRYWGRNTFKDNSENVGAVAILIALLSVVAFRRRQSWFWGGAAVVVFIYALGAETPFFGLYYHGVPLIRKFRAPATSMFIFVFAVAYLGGALVQGILDRRRPRGAGTWLSRVLFWGWPMAISAVALFFLLASESALKAYAYCFYSSLFDNMAANSKYAIALGYVPRMTAYLCVSAILVWVAALLVRWSLGGTYRQLCAVALCSLVIVEGFWLDRRFISTLDFDREFNDRPLTQWFISHEVFDRAQGMGYNIHTYHAATHGVMSTTGYHGNELNWYRDLTRHRGQLVPNIFNGRFLNLANVGYIVNHVRGTAKPDPLVGPEPLDTLAVVGDAVVLRNHYRFPRAFLVGGYEVLESRSDIYEQVLNGDVDLRQTVYLESRPELSPQPPSAPDSAARITDYTPNVITVATSADRDQLLVLTDNWYHAWEVFVDGEKAVLQRAYGSFRTVAVPAGQHEVLFRYNPERYHRARLITIVSVVVVVGVLGACGYRQFRRRRRE